MVAFDVVKSRGGEEPDADATKRVTQAALAEGLVLLSCGVHANTIRILMPLTISDAILAEGMASSKDALVAGERVERFSSLLPASGEDAAPSTTLRGQVRGNAEPVEALALVSSPVFVVREPE